jgi:hypothetical protein
MQAKKKRIKKFKLFSHIGPATSCSFKPESQNSSSRYRELHNQAQALMQSTKKMKKNSNFPHSFGQVPAGCILNQRNQPKYNHCFILVQKWSKDIHFK